MTAPSAAMFLISPSKTWTTTLVTVAAADVLTFNGEDFTAEASGATGNEFNIVTTNMPATAVNLASALNDSSDVDGAFASYATGPFSLALATLANADTLSINGVQFKAVTSGANHTATPREFNLASDHGAADLAAQINGSYGSITGISGIMAATASSTTVTITGTLTTWTPPSTVTHAVMSAANAVVTIKGALQSYEATIASGSADLRCICPTGASFYCNANITGGSSDDSVTNVEPIAVGATGTQASSISFDMGSSGIEPTQPLAVPASSSKVATFGGNGYQWQWDGSSFDYYISATLKFSAAGYVNASPALLTLQNPTVATEGGVE